MADPHNRRGVHLVTLGMDMGQGVWHDVAPSTKHGDESMKNYWQVDWVVQYDGLLHTWEQLTPKARSRIRRLVARGKDSGPLTGRDILHEKHPKKTKD